MNPDAVIATARTTLRQAVALDHPDLNLSLEAERWILGQVWAESRFGASPDWGTSNNWGAVVYHLGDGKWCVHGDHTSTGVAVAVKFQAYDSQLDAARDYLKIMLRMVPRDVLAGHDLHAYAAALYAHRYFTGVAGSDADRINGYVAFIGPAIEYVRERLAFMDHLPDLGTVAGIQAALVQCGFNPGPVDGVMGPKTMDAVMEFQQAHGLVVDGRPGPKTKAAILDVLGG